MISIDRLEEMAIEELETKLNNWKEQVELQSNFIDSLLKATNNSEWLNKTILDDEASEIIEKIELDYAQLDQLKAENEELKKQHQGDKGLITSTGKMNYQLIQEYDKLKTENERLKETFDSLFKVQYKLADNNKKLRQCITEIKEICNNNDELKGNFNLVDCDKYKLGKHNLANKILQKISECEGNDG